MTVKELIEKLSKIDGDLLVVTGGFDEHDIADVETVTVVRIVEHKSWGGNWKISDGGFKAAYIDWGPAEGK